MTLPELLRWQWQGYAGYHRNRNNLLLHIFAVPLFWLGTVLLVMGLTGLAWRPLTAGAVCIVVSMAVQGRGHKFELTPPAPFTGPWNFIGRLFFEQWITFPRFVLSGGWARNFTAGRDAG
ncbi:MAG TPA: Mpo1-like protein [Gammaproteobacteria bacterium]|nr:Mpo1-like protein [Gammaproteobacteria bacterium]